MKPMSPHSLYHCYQNFIKAKIIACCIFCYLLLFHLNLSAQTPDWSWATYIHGTSNDAIQFTDFDNNGNILLAGSFYSPALQIGDTLVISNSYVSASGSYLVIIDTTGETIWAKQLYEESEYGAFVKINDVIFDAVGNIILSGTSYGDNIILDDLYLESLEEGYFSFIIKLSPKGEVMYSHVFEKGANPTSLVSDLFGGWYVTAHQYYYNEGVDLGEIQLAENAGENRMFVAHYTKENIVDWAEVFQGSSDNLLGLETTNGDLIFYGEFSGKTYRVDTFLLIDSSYHASNFFGKCDVYGNFSWARLLSPQSVYVKDAVTIPNGIMLVGWLNDELAIFDSDTIVHGEEINTTFMAKFNLNGELISATESSSFFPGYATINVSPDNLYYVSAQVYNSLWTGVDTIFNETNSGADLAVLVYDTAQLPIFQFVIPLDGDNDMPKVEWDIFGNILLIGAFSEDTLIFNSDTLINIQLSNQIDYFVARSNTCTTQLFPIAIDGLVLSAVEGVSWQWYLNGLPIKGANNQNYTPLQNGNYVVSVKQANGCTFWSETALLPEQIFNNKFDFTIYPNPTIDEIHVYIPFAYESAAIYNALGQLIYQFDDTNQTNLSYANDLKGMYVFVVSANGKTQSHQFVIL